MSSLALCALATPALAAKPTPRPPEAVAAELRDKAVAGRSAAYDFVSELTTRFGPRPAGSAQQNRASAWAAKTLASMGFENVHLETYPVVAWDRGQESAEILAPEPQPLVANALGNTIASFCLSCSRGEQDAANAYAITVLNSVIDCTRSTINGTAAVEVVREFNDTPPKGRQ